MRSGKPEAVPTDRRKKIGFVPPNSSGPARHRIDPPANISLTRAAPAPRHVRQFRSREIMNFSVTRSDELVRPNPIPVSILITLPE
jgi:hypothetical protein